MRNECNKVSAWKKAVGRGTKRGGKREKERVMLRSADGIILRKRGKLQLGVG